MTRPHAIIIGAGFTGVATAHDLALRGFDVTVVERGDICNGTSGRTHGLLHSGARYVLDDCEAAVECIDENMILRKIAAETIEPNGGLFVGIDDSDLTYADAFTAGCEACHIPIQQISARQALEMEPALTPQVLTAFTVPDGTFDPLRLALAFAATAKSHGARFLIYSDVTGMLFDGKGNVAGVKIIDRARNKTTELHGDVVVNAGGPWAGEISSMANSEVPIKPTPGVMVAYNRRLIQRVINRLNEPGDGDIILPQRRMVVVGTTCFEVNEPDYIPVIEEQADLMCQRGTELLPGIAQTKPRGIFMAIRPLIGGGLGRSVARTFKCFDHKELNNIDGLVTITGGKATTLRAMAKKTADVVCEKLGIQAVCTTKDYPLLSYRQYYAFPNE